jgi:hypothetical protein
MRDALKTLKETLQRTGSDQPSCCVSSSVCQTPCRLSSRGSLVDSLLNVMESARIFNLGKAVQGTVQRKA